MYKKLSGNVHRTSKLTQRKMQIELLGINKVIELEVDDPLVINVGDEIAVVGFNAKSGKFKACAYNNATKGVTGESETTISRGILIIIGGLLTFWKIYPIFTDIPLGIKDIALNYNQKKAMKML